MQKNEKVTNCEIPYRKDEKYWILGSSENEFSFFISFNFTTPTDVTLARIILLEFKDSVRHVKGSVAMSYHDKGAPSNLTAAFPNPGRETYSNGILEISKSFSLLLMLTWCNIFRILKAARSGEEHRTAAHFLHSNAPVHRFPCPLDEATAAQEDA